MSIFNIDKLFKDKDYINKMNLNELLKQSHSPKKAGDKKTKLSDVYGIIYRIFCIPENKSYVGQTFSHNYNRDYLSKWNILSRCRQHYNNRMLDSNKNKPLYIALTKYSPDQFIIYEEEQLFNTSIGLINQKEGEYMKKYNTLFPNVYNIEEVGKKYSKLLKDLSDLHEFEIKKYEYIDKTRTRRVKDVCVGVYFGIKNKKIGQEETFKLLKTVDIKNITLVNSNGLRIIVKVKDERDNIRVYFNGTKEKCIDFSKKLTDNIIISPSFNGEDAYKYQLKLDKVLEDKDIITTITGKSYHNESRNCDTYLIMVSGIKNNRTQTLHRVSFGGKSIKLLDSYNTGVDFVEKIKKKINNPEINYILENIS